MSNFNFNKTMLGGRLTADPENKQTPSGAAVTTFTIAVSRHYAKNTEEKPVTDFFKIYAWNGLADFVARFFRRGSAIFVVGRIQNRSYVDHEGTKRYVTEIVAEEISFVESKGETASVPGTGGASVEKPAPLASSYASAEDFASVGSDEDLPF